MKTDDDSPARHRMIGLALALLGIALNRFAAPACAEAWRDIVALAGQLVVVAGLLVIGRGIRLRILNSPTTPAAPDAGMTSADPR